MRRVIHDRENDEVVVETNNMGTDVLLWVSEGDDSCLAILAPAAAVEVAEALLKAARKQGLS